MTHAALQDLVKKWRDDAAGIDSAGYSSESPHNADWCSGAATEKRRCADELSAALSSMEGEAVAWQVRYVFSDGRWSGWAQVQSQSESEYLVSRYAAEGMHAEWRALYTAPPPQQATPPQPEAQVTDAMVERALKAYFHADGSPEHWMRAALTAALTTSGRGGDG